MVSTLTCTQACSSVLIFGSVGINVKVDVNQVNVAIRWYVGLYTSGNIDSIVTYRTWVRFAVIPKLKALSGKEHISSKICYFNSFFHYR